MLNWIVFGIASVIAYVFISAFGQFGGGSGTSGFDSIIATFKPLPFVLLILGNVAWGFGIYYGLQNSRFAIPIALAIGVIISFIYSVVFLGGNATVTKILGAAVILLGIYLMR